MVITSYLKVVCSPKNASEVGDPGASWRPRFGVPGSQAFKDPVRVGGIQDPGPRWPPQAESTEATPLVFPGWAAVGSAHNRAPVPGWCVTQTPSWGVELGRESTGSGGGRLLSRAHL